MKTCPDHRSMLSVQSTAYGPRWYCPVYGCTVACWDGETSTPADDETRRLRQRCHELFDPLWRRKTRFKKRRDAYAWLVRVMGVTRDRAHIGMFDREQCLKLIEELLPTVVKHGK